MSQHHVKVASTAPFSIQIEEPNPHPEDPNYVHVSTKSAVLRGMNHASATKTGPMVTEGVDAELMENWMKANKDTDLGRHFRVITDDEHDAMQHDSTSYGFEPGINPPDEAKEEGVLPQNAASPANDARHGAIGHQEDYLEDTTPQPGPEEGAPDPRS